MAKIREAYWTGDEMVEHTSEFLDALEFKLPGYQFGLIFDLSSGHAKYPPNIALAKRYIRARCKQSYSDLLF